ncbi:aminopeptidase N [Luteococcus peritonei]|uniref:Aminopeptidase N n=1 Tax=Luteococcus peritonei TaxID=88874 RepID=A0ABW4RUZ9_9ACTN
MPDHASLRRDEAETRAALITVRQVHVELDLRRPESFTSATTISFDCTAPGATSFVDFCGTSLDELVLNGRPVAQPHWSGGRIRLEGLAARNELLVRGTMAYSSDGEGLHRHVDAADGEAYLYAMSFLDAAPRWFACFDQPDLKAPVGLDVLAPEHWSVVGNQPASSTAPGRWSIEPGHPLSSYFVTLAAGPWHRIDGGQHGRNAMGRPVGLTLHARASLAEQLEAEAEDILAVTRAGLDAYRRLFDSDYPFEDYAQVFVPDFNAGAMENPGCVVFREQFLGRGPVARRERARRAGTICHEMAHQWFGDLVTMRWWDELWLNESFAEYMGHRVSTEAAGYPLWTDFALERKQWGIDADLSPSTHPVAGNGAADAQAALANFDGISYAKGAAVLRQLATWMGDEAFLAGLREHFAAHAHGNATMADLLSAWRRQGVEGLDEWVEAWLATSGIDLVRVQADDRPRLLREGSRPHRLLLQVHPATASVPAAQPGVEHRIAVEGPLTPLPEAASGSLLLPDADGRGWVRTRPAVVGSGDPWSVPASTLAEPQARVALLGSLRDAWRHGEVPTGRALDLLLDHLPTETDQDLLAWCCGQVEQLCGSWSLPQDRAARRARAAALLEHGRAASEPGSDAHLTWTRALLQLTDSTDLLLGLLQIDGLATLAPDERWLAVRRAVTLGHDPSLVDQELARDDSSAGRLAAARARAQLPSVEAKRAAMELVLAPSQASTYQVQAAATGLFLPDQHELTAPLVAEWFARIGGTAAFRSGWALGAVVRTGYPFSHADRARLAAAQQALQDPGLDPTLERALRDGLALLERHHSALTGLDA